MIATRDHLHVLDSRTHALKATFDGHPGGLIGLDAHKNTAITVGLRYDPHC